MLISPTVVLPLVVLIIAAVLVGMYLDRRELKDAQRGEVPRLKAEIAFRRAMVEGADQDRHPVAWARAQFNLGQTLLIAGTPNADQTLLNGSIEAFEQSQMVFKPDRKPRYWAAAQNNRAMALMSLGFSDSGTTKLLQAIDLYRALREQGQSFDGKVEINLGAALRSVGWRQGRPDLLDESATILNALAHGKKTSGIRSRVDPNDALYELGATLLQHGKLSDDQNKLQEAVSIHRRLVVEWAETEHLPHLQSQLGLALIAVAGRTQDAPMIDEAIDLIRSDLDHLDERDDSFAYAALQDELGKAFRMRGEMTGSLPDLHMAYDACETALALFDRDDKPLDWAETMDNLGHALRALGEFEADAGKLNRAVEAHRAAADLFDGCGNAILAEQARQNLARAERASAAIAGDPKSRG